MDQVARQQPTQLKVPNYHEAWDLVTGRLRNEMPRSQFETWVQPLRPLGYRDRVFRVGAVNTFAVDWVESRLKTRISSMLTGYLNEPVTFKIIVSNSLGQEGVPDASDLPVLAANNSEKPFPPENDPSDEDIDLAPATKSSGKTSDTPRKMMLRRAYGTEKARIIQPERGMFVTMYFMNHWLPLLGHSAFAIILATRSMCYWNPKTGELRNSIETDMAELAARASVSVRTVKDVLNQELVKRFFIRYSVRRIMTPNGVRTAGIFLQVRMDDPLTPEDQTTADLVENDHWFSTEFDDEQDDNE